MPPNVRAALATGGVTLVAQGNALGWALIAAAVAASTEESGGN
ncbi:hypothetical protein ACERIM_18250 [Natrinema sp. H-ect1]